MTSRAPPPRFEPGVFDGVRYDAAYTASDAAPRTRSGGIAAIDEASGRTLWTLVLWTSPVEDERGLFHPPRFLRRVTRGDVAGELRVEDEFGVLYLVDQATHAVRTVEPPRTGRFLPEPGG
jgi:hypothetical protein